MFNLSYAQFLDTPPEIVFTDLYMLSLEDDAREWVEAKTPQPKIPRVPGHKKW